MSVRVSRTDAVTAMHDVLGVAVLDRTHNLRRYTMTSADTQTHLAELEPGVLLLHAPVGNKIVKHLPYQTWAWAQRMEEGMGSEQNNMEAS
jgi:hypothetical protein